MWQNVTGVMREMEESPRQPNGVAPIPNWVALSSFQRSYTGQEESLGKPAGKDRNGIIRSKPYAVGDTAMKYMESHQYRWSPDSYPHGSETSLAQHSSTCQWDYKRFLKRHV